MSLVYGWPGTPVSRERRPAGPYKAPIKRKYTPREKYGLHKIPDWVTDKVQQAIPEIERPRPLKPHEFYTMLIEHNNRAFDITGRPSAAPIPHRDTLTRSCHRHVPDVLGKQPVNIIPTVMESKCVEPPARGLRPLFKRPSATLIGSPGLHKAFIPKLHAIDSWQPRLYSQLLPKYLLALDSICIAHLYSNLGRLQPPHVPERSMGWVQKEAPNALKDYLYDEGGQPDARRALGARFSEENMASAAMRERSAFELIVHGIGASVIPKLSLLGPGPLSVIPCGLADCNILDAPLLLAWESACLEHGFQRMGPRHLAALSSGIGRMGVLPGLEWQAEFYGHVRRKLKRFKIQQLAELMHGLACMRLPLGKSTKDMNTIKRAHPVQGASGPDKHEGADTGGHSDGVDCSRKGRACSGDELWLQQKATEACMEMCAALPQAMCAALGSGWPRSGSFVTALIQWWASLGEIHHQVQRPAPSLGPSLGEIHHQVQRPAPSLGPSLGEIHHQVQRPAPSLGPQTQGTDSTSVLIDFSNSKSATPSGKIEDNVDPVPRRTVDPVLGSTEMKSSSIQAGLESAVEGIQGKALHFSEDSASAIQQAECPGGGDRALPSSRPAGRKATGLPVRWLKWYAKYIMQAMSARVSGGRPGLIKPRDVCTLLEALSQLYDSGAMHLLPDAPAAYDSASSCDAPRIPMNNTDAVVDASGNALSAASPDGPYLAVYQLLHLRLLPALLTAVRKQRVGPKLLARTCGALYKLGKWVPLGRNLMRAVERCTLNHMATLSAAEVAAVARLLSSRDDLSELSGSHDRKALLPVVVPPHPPNTAAAVSSSSVNSVEISGGMYKLLLPAAWSAAALLVTQRDEVLRGSDVMDLIHALQSVGCEVPQSWTQAVIKETQRQIKAGLTSGSSATSGYSAISGSSATSGSSAISGSSATSGSSALSHEGNSFFVSGSDDQQGHHGSSGSDGASSRFDFNGEVHSVGGLDDQQESTSRHYASVWMPIELSSGLIGAAEIRLLRCSGWFMSNCQTDGSSSGLRCGVLKMDDVLMALHRLPGVAVNAAP
ncbi:hypothetical protein CEUSTIGMA_g5997.t1 [Chlamydomonas eustigma]|uniref:Uncharacterized protein n=1 Tax=Chlamydomonas eustigma TaxID=1157962 RepID=A0A250X664_9CHLO|nr:hypothetical protein CEUSTIGMA_g5997.t1 [Chlamydomonas eustigma]|eukprot:GAX78557.1 hypothetical protein CEUSTIGMA_g5997.t1 [Chlamydomonas eustigma]